MKIKEGFPQQIHIIGSVGSGKSTLARKISTLTKLPHIELDNIVWERHKYGDKRRTTQERDTLLLNVT